jgi:uncharacterized protein YrrD
MGEYFKETGGKSMRRASDLLGLPVFTREDRELGTVREILVDLERGLLCALVMPVKVLAEPELIPADKVLSMGLDSVLLPRENIILEGEEANELRRGKFSLEQMRSLTVVTDADSRLGNVQDLILDQCRVVALELSDGLIQDVFQGRETVAWPSRVSILDDKLIVPEGTRSLPRGAFTSDSWQGSS